MNTENVIVIKKNAIYIYYKYIIYIFILMYTIICK